MVNTDHSGHRLSWLMQRANVSGVALAKELSVIARQPISKATISNWRARGISKDGLFWVSAFFECDPMWLEKGTGEPFPQRLEGVGEYKKIVLVPYVSWIDIERTANLESLLQHSSGKLPALVEVSKKAFATTVTGSAAVAKDFRNGEYICVDPEVTPEDGRFVLARASPETPAILRRYDVDGATRYLVATNEDWPAADRRIKLTDQSVIIGTVVFSGRAR